MAQTNLIGKNILGYTVGEKLGSGAFGTVYKVVKTNAAGQYVRALKHITIPTEKQYNSVLNSMGGDVSKADSYFSQMLNNIVSEIRILNDLSEKGVQHIVRYYENDILVTDAPKRYDIFILMEYLTPLEDYIQNENFLVRDVVRLGLDVLYGLQSCHDNGVIHRDIKDDNIFVSEKGEYKIGDFGVSKVLKDSSKAESLKGTPNFLAPEVYLGKESYTKSVDLYSLGIVLYRLLNYSRNPFLPRFPEQYFAQDEDRAFEERMSGKTPALPSLGGEEIGRVIVKAISNSSERIQTADEFIRALEWAVSNTPVDVLDEKVKFDVTSYEDSYSELKPKEYSATLGEAVSAITLEEHIDDKRSSSINRQLFESISEDTVDDVHEVEEVVRRQNINIIRDGNYNTFKRMDDVGQPSKNGVETALTKKNIAVFAFLSAFIILLVGILVYFTGMKQWDAEGSLKGNDIVQQTVNVVQTKDESVIINLDKRDEESFNAPETIEETIDQEIDLLGDLKVGCGTNVILVDDSVKLIVATNSFYFDNATKGLNFYSDNTDVATVDSQGIVTGISGGFVNITASYEEKEASYQLYVARYPGLSDALVSAEYDRIGINMYEAVTVDLMLEGDIPEKFNAICYCSGGLSMTYEWGQLNGNILPLTMKLLSSDGKEGKVTVLIYPQDEPNNVVAATCIEVGVN